MTKFLRNYLLTIQGADGQDIEIAPPFTMSFNINRGTGSSLNAGQISVLNLSPTIREQLFEDRIDVRNYRGINLQAGYNSELALIFKGNITQASSQRQGSDIITQFECRDGDFATRGALSNRTFAGGSLKDLVTGLAGDFNTVQVSEVGELGDEVIKPVVLVGNSYDLIKTYTKDKVFIDLEELKVLKEDEVVEGLIPAFNSNTGLLNTPKREGAFLTIDTVFEPRIISGQVVDISSRINPAYDGQYKVIGMRHQGVISDAVGGEIRSSFDLLVGSQLFGGFTKV